MAKTVRVDKLFSSLGLLSRSECKKAVKAGEILINGRVCKSPEEKLTQGADEVIFRGSPVDTSEFVYYMFNKPAGYITAKDDPRSATVFDLIEDPRPDLAAVGRLDKDTTGILLVTNDGNINHRLLSPKFHVPKTYITKIDGKLTKEDVLSLQNGVDIGDDTKTLPAEVHTLDEENPQCVALTITEGRYHQVKRMFEAVGKPVLELHRSDFGPLHLDETLPEGKLRPLTEEELNSIFKSAGIE